MRESIVIELFVKLYLIITVIVSWNAVSAAAVGQKDQYQSLTAGEGLYNASDNVIILNATNFKKSVYRDTKSWLVEFYNSWCGFCFRFAPTWKNFATDILGWKDIVVVAVIDCADEENNPMCRDYEIMHYPMLKFFSVNAHPSSMGIVLEKDDSIENIRHILLDQLEKEQQEGRGSTWPNITPYRNTGTTDIWKAVPNSVKYFFLLFENADSYLGMEVILDMHKVPDIHIRRVTSENEPLCVMNKVTKFPSLIVFSRNESQKVLNIKIPIREGVYKVIRDYISSKGIKIDDQIITSQSREAGNKIMSTSITNKYAVQESPQTDEDYLFQLDLENALRYSLSREIPLMKMIKDEKMDALKAYINVLAAYFPLRYSGAFLEVIRDIIYKKSTILGEEFSQLVKTTEEEMAPVYSGPQEWIGCKGSKAIYRGYPCGLWTMFHMLTVNFAMQNKDNNQHNPATVLNAMHGYIKNFFGCVDCANHFVEMAAKNKISEVHSGDENIMWLWKSHNEVNARLANDETEDPLHRKMQYPSSEHCPMCKHENGTWNEEQVLHYLKNKYSYAGINYRDSIEKHEQSSNVSKSKVRQERLAPSKYTNIRKLGWDFTIFDISICVVLYIASAAILILVCIKFAVKRSYKKRGYINLLGKV